MVDLTKLSDDDLFTLRDGDLSKMSDEGLFLLSGRTPPEHGGLMKAGKAAYYGAKAGLEEALGAPEKWVTEAKEAQQKVGYTPTTEEDVAQATGFGKATKWLSKEVGEPLAGMVGRYAIPTVAGTAAGIVAPEAVVPAALARAGAMFLTDVPIEAQENIAYQKQISPEVTPSTVKAWAAAVPQAVLASIGAPWLKGPWQSAATKAADELAPKILKGELTVAEANQQLGSKVAAVAKGIPENIAQASAMMIGTEALRRGQAGQDVTSPEAMAEYGTALKTAGLFSPIFGTMHGLGARAKGEAKLRQAGLERGVIEEKARRAEEEQAAAEEQKQYETPTPEDLAYFDALQKVKEENETMRGLEGMAPVAPLEQVETKRPPPPEPTAAEEGMRHAAPGETLDMFAQMQGTRTPEVPPVPEAPAPKPFQSVLTADLLKATGLRPQSGFFKRLVDKDLANPEHQAQVLQTLSDIRSNPNLASSTKNAVEVLAGQQFAAVAQQGEMFGPRGGVRPEARGTQAPKPAKAKKEEAPVEGPPPMQEITPEQRAENARLDAEKLAARAAQQGEKTSGPETPEAQQAKEEGPAAPTTAPERPIEETPPAAEQPAPAGIEAEKLTPEQAWEEMRGEGAPDWENLSEAAKNYWEQLHSYDQANMAEADRLTRQHRAAAVAEKIAAGRDREDNVRLSEETRPTAPEQRTTVEDTHSALRDWFIDPNAAKNKLTIVQTAEELPEAVKQFAASKGKDLATIQGVVHEGKAHLVADNIAKGHERSVFMHEVGAHLGLDEKATAEVAKRVAAWGTFKEGTLERELADRVQARMDAAGTETPAERVAYAVEEAVRAGVKPRALKTTKGWSDIKSVQDLVDVLAKVFRSKVEHMLGRNIRNFTAEDLVDLTYGAARDVIAERKAPEELGTRFSEAAREAFKLAGRELPVEDTRSNVEKAQEVIREAIPKLSAAKPSNLLDRVSAALDVSAPLERALSRSIRSVLPEEMANELLTRLKLSQTVHDEGLADAAYLAGGARYDKDTGLFVAEDSKANGKQIAEDLAKMAETHGLTFAQATATTNLYLEMSRLAGLYDAKRRWTAEAEQLEKSGNPASKKLAAKKRKQVEDITLHASEDVAKTVAKNLREAYPEVVQVEKTKNAIRDWTAKLLVDTGVWDKEYAQDMLANLEWVPFNREFAEGEEPKHGFTAMVNSLQVRGRERAFAGSERKVAPVLDNFENWTRYAIRRAVNNQKAAELGKASVQWLPGEAQNVRAMYDGAESRTVYYLEDGKPKYVLFDDPLKAQVFKGNEAFGKATLPIIGGFLDKFNKFFRDNILTFPLFPIMQLSMDSLAATQLAGVKPQFAAKIPFLAVQEALKTMRGTSETAKHLARYAATGVKDYNAAVAKADLDVHAGFKKLKGWERYKDSMYHFGMVADNAVRQAVYLAAKDSGLSEAQAVNRAFEIINFRTRLGSRGLAVAARNVVFMNAFYAATRASLNAMVGSGITPMARLQAKKTYLSNMAWLSALSMVHALVNTGDPDYEKMTPEERTGKITLPGLGGWGIPIRPDAVMLPKIFAEMLARQFTEHAEDPDRLKKTALNALGKAILSGPAPVPTPILVSTELTTNHSFFTGRPIVGAGQEHLEAYRQYSASTSELAKDIGKGSKDLLELAGIKTEGLSPQKLDHLLRGVFGMNGAMAVLLTNSMATDRPAQSYNDFFASLPGMSRVGAKDFDSSIKTDFYDLTSTVEQAVATANSMKNLGDIADYQEYVQKTGELQRMAPFINKVKLTLNQLRQQINRVTESNATSEEKLARITELKTREAEFMKQIEPQLRQMRQQL